MPFPPPDPLPRPPAPSADPWALLAQANERISELIAKLGEFNARFDDMANMLARANERIAELAAAAGRNKRKPPTTSVAKVATPSILTPEQAAAFENRPIPPEIPAKVKAAQKPRKSTGRNPLPGHLPAEKSESRPPSCGKCSGTRLDVVDHFTEEKLTVVAEHQRRRVTERYTCRCRDCGTRTSGEAPPAPYPKSKVTCEWLAWFIVEKFLKLVPLDRILRVLKLQGILMSMGTAVRLVDKAAQLLDAVDGEHWRQLKAGRHMASDGTHLAVCVPGIAGTHKGYLEVYLRGPTVVFQYEAEKGSANLLSKLKGYTGVVQVDAEHRFNALFVPGGAIEAGCNAHGRRKFEAAETNQPVLAVEGGRFVSAMFAAEAEAQEAGLDGDRLRAWRQSHVGPLYTSLRAWMDSVEPGLIPDDPLAQTIRYYRNHWDALRYWVDHPEIPPDNSRAEREFQTVAKARLSWLHAGSSEGAHRAATLLGLVASARNEGVDVERYFCWVFQRRGTWKDRYKLAAVDLTPAAYKREMAKDRGG